MAGTKASSHDPTRGVYMISVAAELAGMHPQTLRIYETRGLITPKRSPKNTRLYSQDDVDRLRRIQELTTELGMNLAGVEKVFELEEEMRADARADGSHPARGRPHGAGDAGGDRAHATLVPPSWCPTSRLERRSSRGTRRACRYPSGVWASGPRSTTLRLRFYATGPLHHQVAGGAPGRAAPGKRPAQPAGCAGSSAARPARAGGRHRRAGPEARRGRTSSAVRGPCQRGSSTASTVITGDATRPPSSGRRLGELLRRADEAARGMGDEYISTEHLLLALAGDPNIDLRRRSDQLADAVRPGARATPRHRPDPRGQVPGARALRARPHERPPRTASSTR